MAILVYRDLTRAAWHKATAPKRAVRDPATGKPQNFPEVILSGVTFRLSEASRVRCLRQVADPQCRHGWDVHAYASGEEVAAAPGGPRVRISYDKTGCGKFVRRDTGAAVRWCEYVVFAADGHSYAVGAIEEG